MQKLNLTEFLKSLGSPILTEIYGKDKLQAMIDCLDISVSEKTITDLLKSRHGTQILSNKVLRGHIFANLDGAYINFLKEGKYDENANATIDDREKLIKTSWNRNTNSIQRLIEIFDLEEDYLPQKVALKDSTFEIKPSFTLFPHQKRVKDKFVNFLREGKKRMIINMPTGAGKTRTSVEGLVDYWRSFAEKESYVVWLAHSEELCEQAVETIKNTWEIRGEKNLRIYRLWGEHNPELAPNEGGFIVTSFQKIYSMMKSNKDEVFREILNIKKKSFAVVVDEAHKSIASTYQDAINYITNLDKTFLIGLTATPGRGWQDDENKKLAEYYENRLITITDDDDNELDDPVKFLQEKGYLAYVKTEEVKTDIVLELSEQEKNYLNTQFDLSDKFLYKLGENQNRNLCILAQIIKYYREDKSIIVFACSLDHASFLNEMCSQKQIKSASIDKNTTMTSRRKYIDLYKNREIKVLFNFGVLTHGFDAPNTDIVIIARPTQSPILYSQMIGRGLRGPEVGGNAECILVDIKDNILGLPNERRTFTMYRDNYSKN
jgi:DNA repair protein RadD|tara:strand:+ start:277 stop:1920 length:1644 start_codon:yes stop_codon:yes gene_type:complete